MSGGDIKWERDTTRVGAAREDDEVIDWTATVASGSPKQHSFHSDAVEASDGQPIDISSASVPLVMDEHLLTMQEEEGIG